MSALSTAETTTASPALFTARVLQADADYAVLELETEVNLSELRRHFKLAYLLLHSYRNQQGAPPVYINGHFARIQPDTECRPVVSELAVEAPPLGSENTRILILRLLNRDSSSSPVNRNNWIQTGDTIHATDNFIKGNGHRLIQHSGNLIIREKSVTPGKEK